LYPDFVLASDNLLIYKQKVILKTPMSVTLDQILADTRLRVETLLRSSTAQGLREKARQHTPRGFRRALLERAATGAAVIAELKKASPSKGVIRAHFSAVRLARELEQAGAAALSVLTDEKYFQGSLSNLQEASTATRIPCLRKDFIIHEVQLEEARAHGADAVLLIAAGLRDDEMLSLFQQARELSLDVLCEVHDQRELDRAMSIGFDIIGVNSRDLRTFHVDPEAPLRLAEKLPRNVLRVAESGIHTAARLRQLRDAGYQAFLIGESLMYADSPGDKLRELLSEVSAQALGTGQAGRSRGKP
jgi:indole-3-glycerol phosphate synthase